MIKIFKTSLMMLVLALFFGFNLNWVNKSIDEMKTVNEASSITSLTTINDKVLNDLYTRFPEVYGHKKVYRIRNLYDMNDNIYNLVEFMPSGYTIYNDEYSKILETSAEAQSPYSDSNGKLIYLGAFNYYHYDSGIDSIMIDKEIIHCLDAFSINLNKNSLYELKTISNRLKTNIEKSLVNLISNETGDYGISTLSSNSKNVEVAEIRQPQIIKNADTSGFNTNGEGRCGYVAGSLILFYAARSWGWNYLYENDIIGEDLVDDLQGNRTGSSWAVELEDALNDYMNEKGATHNAKVNMWHIPAAHTFYDRVKEDKPVILFGKVPSGGTDGNNKVNHAVVVYKVSRNYKKHWFGIRTYSNYVYTVHWGHDTDRNEIDISHDAITIGGLVNLHK